MKRVLLGSSAQASLRYASPTVKQAIRKSLKALAAGNITQLDLRELRQHGSGPPVYRLRVGTWRVAFRITPRAIEVVRVFPRRDGYGWMERLP